MKETLNRYLNIYQLIGIIVSMAIVSMEAIEEGKMLLYFIPIVGILLLPFTIVSSFSLLNIKRYRETVQFVMWIGTFLLLAPSFFLPFFFEWGGLVIALICAGIAYFIWRMRAEIQWQILIFGIIGTTVVTVLLGSFISIMMY